VSAFRRRYHLPGTAPGTYDVERTREAPPSQVRVVDYGPDTLAAVEELETLDLEEPTGVRWIRISGHPSFDVLEALKRHLGMDPLALEDIVTAGQRPKLNEFPAGWFLTLTVPGSGVGQPYRQLSLYLTGNTLVSHIVDEDALYAPIEARLQDPHSRLRASGAHYLLYSLLDLVGDHFFPLLDAVGDLLEGLEAQVLTRPSQELLGEVHEMRSTLLVLRKVIWATRELINDLLRQVQTVETEAVRMHLSDAYDHAVSAIDLVETYRDMATSLVEVHLSMMSNRMNEIMRVLTIIATVFIPPTFIVGVYGMNFDRSAGPWSMPELGSPYGYLLVMGLMGLMMLGMLLYFRVKRWW
jgi:magnesium transporter